MGLSMSDIRQTLILRAAAFWGDGGFGHDPGADGSSPRTALTIYLEAEKLHPNRPDVQAAIERLSDES